MSRGLWLVFLELTVVRCLGWAFNFNYDITGLLVIWALGWAMIVLAALIYLPNWLITVFAVVMIAGHNLLDSVQPERFGSLAWVWKILHVPRDPPFPGPPCHRLSARAMGRGDGGGIRLWRMV